MIKLQFIQKIKQKFSNFFHKSPNDNRKRPKNKREITARRAYSSRCASAEGFIPLASREWQFEDLSFYNPNFRSQLEDDDSVDLDLSICESTEITKEPIQILFPGLSEDNHSILTSHSSTSEVTKLLVGQKADFSRLRSSRKLLPLEHALTSVQEMPQEEAIKTKNAQEMQLYLQELLPSRRTASESRSIASDEEICENSYMPMNCHRTHSRYNTILAAESSTYVMARIAKRPRRK